VAGAHGAALVARARGAGGLDVEVTFPEDRQDPAQDDWAARLP
jgi:hypothetical protein